MKGFRTMYASFHHFTPEQAIRILRDAVESGEGIAIFELTERSFISFVVGMMLFWLSPLGSLIYLSFSFQRLLWTFAFPVVPLIASFDGVVSSLRSYTDRELFELARLADPENKYKWEFIKHRSFPYPCTSFVGLPRAPHSRGRH